MLTNQDRVRSLEVKRKWYDYWNLCFKIDVETEMMCLCLCQAWEPLHSSEGFALAGSGWHSWATQSWSLAAAGRLSQQPWPTWTLPHPNYQGNIRGGAACCNNLLLLYNTRAEVCSLTQANMQACILSRLGLLRKVYVWFTRTSSGTTYAVFWACVYMLLCYWAM